MGLWYQPPGPYVGGKQPYDPGRWVPIPSGSDPNPSSRALLYEAVRAWDPPPPQPTQLVRYFPIPSESAPPVTQKWYPDPSIWPQQTWGTQTLPFTPQVTVTTTSFVPAPNEWLSGILSSWQPGPPVSQVYPKLIVSVDNPPPRLVSQDRSAWQTQFQYPQTLPFTPQVSVTTPAQPYTQPWLSTVLNSWITTPQPTQLVQYQPIPSESAPPPTTWAQLYQLVRSWDPPPPAPYQLIQRIVTGAATDNPPFPGINYLPTLIQIWQPGPPQPTQLVQYVVQEGPPTPPTPTPTPIPSPFGGFWSTTRSYGYDSVYDKIRDEIVTTTQPRAAEPVPEAFKVKPIDYHFVKDRVFGSVAQDMRAFWENELEDQRRDLDEEEEEIMLLFTLLH
jgi:hypothetical protein